MDSKTVPNVLKSDERHAIDGQALVAIGYTLDYNAESGRLTVAPDRSVDRIVDLDFVCNVVESFGFSLMQATANQAVFRQG